MEAVEPIRKSLVNPDGALRNVAHDNIKVRASFRSPVEFHQRLRRRMYRQLYDGKAVVLPRLGIVETVLLSLLTAYDCHRKIRRSRGRETHAQDKRSTKEEK